MFVKPKVSRGEVLLSIFLGICASIISVLILWNGIELVEDRESVLTASEVGKVDAVLYALQHGVFSSEQSAATFQRQHPSLNNSVIVWQKDQYYLWSALHVSKVAVDSNPPAFSKKIEISSNSCTEKTIRPIPKLLVDEKALKNNFEGPNIPKDWHDTVTAVSALTKDEAQTRLLLLEHYRQKHACLTLHFD